MQEQINIFKAKIKSRYPDLKIGYSYDHQEDYYHIWHTNSQLQFEDDAFPGFVGGLIKECFYSHDIFNFSFGYDYLEDEKSKSNYEVNNYLDSHFKKINLEFTENPNTPEPIFYDAIENCNSTTSWSKLDNINLVFDSLDLSFFNQSLRQAELLVDLIDYSDDQTEKALAA